MRKFILGVFAALLVASGGSAALANRKPGGPNDGKATNKDGTRFFNEQVVVNLDSTVVQYLKFKGGHPGMPLKADDWRDLIVYLRLNDGTETFWTQPLFGDLNPDNIKDKNLRREYKANSFEYGALRRLEKARRRRVDILREKGWLSQGTPPPSTTTTLAPGAMATSSTVAKKSTKRDPMDELLAYCMAHPTKQKCKDLGIAVPEAGPVVAIGN